MHEPAAAPWSIFARDDGAGFHEEGDFIQRRINCDDCSGAAVDVVGEVIVVEFAWREVDRYAYCAFCNDWLYN